MMMFSAAVAAPGGLSAEGSREVLSLDPGWRFHLGDIPFPEVKGHGATYNNAKAGTARGAASPDFDDTDWRQVDLPHDWVVEGPFDPQANVSQGYRPRGFAWYRRYFRLDPAERGRHFELRFDGIATHATIWLNGTLIHRNFCGYTSMYVDVTSLVRFGNEINSIAVRVDADEQEGWWYEGGGIYRHTWLVKRDAVHIVTDGVFAQPVRGADGKWTIPVEVTVENSGDKPARAGVESVVLDAAGREVARGGGEVEVAGLRRGVATYAIPVENPKLWSVDEPNLYRVVTRTKVGDRVTDEETTPAGFRTIRFDVDKGFFLNDKPLVLKGTCNHQDHAGVGVAVPASLWDFRIRRLKEMGSNAYRCAHNPPAKEFLEACDRLGMLVMDENRIFNPTPEYVRQLEWMVRRDRNHPSVILWSVFNEEPMQGTEQGYEMVRRMADVVRQLDATRPVTAAMNGGLFAPKTVAHAVDVVGFNYQIGAYDRFRRENPTLALTSSEDTSALMTRGEFTTDKAAHVLDSYDTQTPSWGATHRKAWQEIAERPWLAGGFVWTGFDYRGEPTPFTWPSVSSFFGIMDTCGFPKSAYFMRQAFWLDRPVLELIPHWNWPGREGQPIKVMAITNADTVTLSLNGKVIGEKPVDRFEFISWDVPYAPGRLEAVAKKDGREVARTAVETTGEPVRLELIPDRAQLAGDGRDALPVTVRALDAKGRPVPTTHLPVTFALTGPGAIIGHGNGDPNCHDPEKGDARKLFNGLAQVILQSQVNGQGELRLRASAPGVEPAEVTVAVRGVPRPAFVPEESPRLAVQRWRMSPVTAERPDATQTIADNDMNSWVTVSAGTAQKFADGTFAIFRASFQPHSQQRREGGRLAFREITGKAEVWLDDKSVGRKDAFAPGPLVVDLPPGDKRTVSVVVETEPGRPAGITGPVEVEAAAQ